MKEDGRSLESSRRAFLVASGVAVAVPAAGCLNGGGEGGEGNGREEAETYQRWVPAEFEPSFTYMKMTTLRDNDVSLGAEEDTEIHGLTLNDVDVTIEMDRANALVAEEGVTVEVDGEQVDEYGGFTVHESDEHGEYVATDGSALVEGDSIEDIELVIDAYEGEGTRLRDDDEVFESIVERLSYDDVVRFSRRGDGDGVFGRAVEVAPETSSIEYVAHGDGEMLDEIEAGILAQEDYIGIEAEEIETEDGFLVADGTVPNDRLFQALGTVGEDSSQGEEVDEAPTPQIAVDVEFDSDAEEATVSIVGGDRAEEVRVFVDGETVHTFEPAEAGDETTVSVSEDEEVRVVAFDDGREVVVHTASYDSVSDGVVGSEGVTGSTSVNGSREPVPED